MNVYQLAHQAHMAQQVKTLKPALLYEPDAWAIAGRFSERRPHKPCGKITDVEVWKNAETKQVVTVYICGCGQTAILQVGGPA